MHDKIGARYFPNLQRNVRVYVEALSEYIKLGGRHGDMLDKPDAQRLVELCVHTIPVFCHAPLES